MRSRLVAVVAALSVLVAAVLVGVVVTMASSDDDGWPGRHDRNGMPMSGAMSGPMWGAMSGPMSHAQVRDEYGYLAEMVAHHEEAITAARELARSERPQIRRLGADIVASQTAQVEQMRGWLAEWYPDRSGEVAYEPMMRDLSGLSGDRLDRVFLQDMLGHHMAAVMMSQQLLVRGLAEHDEVEELAADIRDEQHAEIAMMQRWLRAWFGGGRGWMHG